MTFEQRPPVNNGHYFCVPSVVIVHMFNCAQGILLDQCATHAMSFVSIFSNQDIFICSFLSKPNRMNPLTLDDLSVPAITFVMIVIKMWIVVVCDTFVWKKTAKENIVNYKV